jgi:hypothetical protein
MLTVEGFIISRTKESTTDHQDIACSNSLCGRFFTKPLKAVNLCSKKPEPYLACPYCLTEVKPAEASLTIQAGPSQESKGIVEETASYVENKIAESAFKAQCSHHFGYLSERSTKERIPEECMICENVLNCMSKKAKS